VNLGISVENAINGNRSFLVDQYNERLVCTNGMLRRGRGHTSRIPHQGDIELKAQQAVVQAADQAIEMVPLMRHSAERLMMPDDIRKARRVIGDTTRGGGRSLSATVVQSAMRESATEGRQAEEVTLWNFVNGVTEAAHSAKSLQRRVQIESLGFDLLRTVATQN